MEHVAQPDPALPKGRGIEAAIRTAIASDAFPEGSRLPSTRDLAGEWQVARGTVVAVIDDLVAEGVLEARARTGIFVARRAGQPARAAHEHAPLPGRPRFDLRPGRAGTGVLPPATVDSGRPPRRSASPPHRARRPRWCA